MGYSRKKLDLTGQRYGQLTVVERAENIGDKTAWLCRCDCGRQVVVITKRLRSGHTKSCGCQWPRKGTPGENLPGLTYIDGTCVEMLRAKTIRCNNTSGVPGVDWQKQRGRWRASICFKGKRYYLGSFESFNEAVTARKQAEIEMHDGFLRQFAQ